MSLFVLRDGRAAEAAPICRPDPAKLPQTRVKQARAMKALGYTGQAIAEFFNVDRRTVTRWMRDLPAGAEAEALAVFN
jgi:transposase